jgi:glycosyltransferase involved in cell wall biosynthesis
MHIGLDYRTVRWSHGTGIHRYRDRLRHIVSQDFTNAGNICLLRDQPAAEAGQADIVRADIYRKAQRKFRLTGKITRFDCGVELDIFHWSHPVPLSAKGCCNIYTIHDIIPILAPALSAIEPRRFTKLITELIAGGANFTAVSQQTAKEFIAWTGIDPARVFCTYQWVPAIQPELPTPDSLLPSSYFLVLGRVEPRKNIARIVAAWQQADTGIPLVIAGPGGHWSSKRDKSDLDALLSTPGIIRLGWTDDETADRIILHSRALLMPSLAEGFGLPIAEAMAAGVPVIGARSALAEEICGDAAMLVDPHCTKEMADAIRDINADDDLRVAKTAQGKLAMARFNADNFTTNLRNAYQHFCN